MSAKFRADRPSRRSHVLLVERLETRDLLSVLPIAWRGVGGRHVSGLNAASASLQTLGGGGDPGSSGGSATAAEQPTPHELAREHFVGKIAAHFDVGPGRFTDQAASIFFLGQGGSTMASHTNLQMIVFTPTDLVNGTITGQAAFTGRNIGSTGNVLGFDLMGDPQSLVHGLPTHFTWMVNGSSGGLFSGSSGQGTLDIHYVPGGKIPQRAFAAGKAFITVQGMVNVVGIYNNLAAPGNRPKNP